MKTCACSADTLRGEGISPSNGEFLCNSCNLPVDHLMAKHLLNHEPNFLLESELDDEPPICTCSDETLKDWGYTNSKLGRKCNYCFFYLEETRIFDFNPYLKKSEAHVEFAFCPMCGVKQFNLLGQYCQSCGHRLREIRRRADTPQSRNSEIISATSNFGSNVSLSILMSLGIFLLVFAMQTLAELQNKDFVTFDLTLNNLLNGGWVVYYWGPAALIAQEAVSLGLIEGMNASEFQIIVLIFLAIGFLLMLPALIRFFDFLRSG